MSQNKYLCILYCSSEDSIFFLISLYCITAGQWPAARYIVVSRNNFTNDPDSVVYYTKQISNTLHLFLLETVKKGQIIFRNCQVSLWPCHLR